MKTTFKELSLFHERVKAQANLDKYLNKDKSDKEKLMIKALEMSRNSLIYFFRGCETKDFHLHRPTLEMIDIALAYDKVNSNHSQTHSESQSDQA